MGGCGIAAAIAALPGSFMWQLYRMVLGRDEIPPSPCSTSPTDLAPDALLPELINQPHFEPLQRFLTNDTDLRKRTNSPNAWLTCSTNTRSTVPTGWKTGLLAAINCATGEANQNL